jgi:hypothetical protein
MLLVCDWLRGCAVSVSDSVHEWIYLSACVCKLSCDPLM